MDGIGREKDDKNMIGDAKRIGHLLEWIGGQESAKKVGKLLLNLSQRILQKTYEGNNLVPKKAQFCTNI
jgi:hypothetical protein